MVSPTISVLMPVYNAERYLSEAVESILAQTFSDFEFIIVDDGSTDKSLAILRKYAAEDSRIRLISRPNTGYVVALNEMLQLANGEFIARMDADDVCLPARFQTQINYLRENPDCLAVGCRVDLIDPDGETIGHWNVAVDHQSIDNSNLSGTLAMVHPSLLIRRDALRSIGGYRNGVKGSEDLDMLLRMAEVGRLANVPETLLLYRRHSESYTHSLPGQVSEAANQAIKEAWQRRGLGIPPLRTVYGPELASVAFNHQTWAWVALSSGNFSAARKHACRALRLAPFSIATWRVVYCSLRGY